VADPRDFSDFEFRTITCAAIDDGDRAAMHALFDAAYRDANHAYLEKSLTRIRYAAFATEAGRPAGFALADMRVLDLPRLPATTVVLAGMCCIDAAYRRRGLFAQLERLAAMAAGPAPV